MEATSGGWLRAMPPTHRPYLPHPLMTSVPCPCRSPAASRHSARWKCRAARIPTRPKWWQAQPARG
eukprot:6083762-Alexandrium_andersonii.AAC.1